MLAAHFCELIPTGDSAEVIPASCGTDRWFARASRLAGCTDAFAGSAEVAGPTDAEVPRVGVFRP